MTNTNKSVVRTVSEHALGVCVYILFIYLCTCVHVVYIHYIHTYMYTYMTCTVINLVKW